MRKETVAFVIIGLLLIINQDFIIIEETNPVPYQQNLATPGQSDTPIVIIGDLELAEHSSKGTGNKNDPYEISGLNIVYNRGTCIIIQNTSAYFIVKDSIFKSIPIGTIVFDLIGVENGLIENCTIRGSSIGVRLTNCTNCIISDTTSVVASQAGFQIIGSDKCTIQNCITQRSLDGVYIESSNDTLVVNSTIYRNKRRGLSIGLDSENTTVYNNRLGWNPTNAHNDGSNTDFTNGIDSGNAWSDYVGFGAYWILGSVTIADTHPTRFTDTTKPIINSPEDIVFDAESQGNTLTWSASDDIPYLYQLFLENMAYNSEVWDGSDITVLLDGLPTGAFTMIMNVTDAAGNWAIDEVVVEKVNFMLSSIDMGLVVWASALTVVMLIALVIVVKKMT
ncbi:MAG: NosD domain-containing protein [Candidatus Thorarchaeota archaeon]